MATEMTIENEQESDSKTQLSEYRSGLIEAEHKSQEDYDKTLVTLSAGALGISLAFIKDIIGANQPEILWAVIAAWALWALSLASVVSSYFSSRLALRAAIIQTDNENYEGGVGGAATIATHYLNGISGISFIAGVCFFILFAANNIGASHMSEKRPDASTEKQVPAPPPREPIPSSRPEPLTGVIPPPPPPSKK